MGGNAGLGWRQTHPLHQYDVPSFMHSSLAHRVGELGASLPGLHAAQGGGAGVWVGRHAGGGEACWGGEVAGSLRSHNKRVRIRPCHADQPPCVTRCPEGLSRNLCQVATASHDASAAHERRAQVGSDANSRAVRVDRSLVLQAQRVVRCCEAQHGQDRMKFVVRQHEPARSRQASEGSHGERQPAIKHGFAGRKFQLRRDAAFASGPTRSARQARPLSAPDDATPAGEAINGAQMGFHRSGSVRALYPQNLKRTPAS